MTPSGLVAPFALVGLLIAACSVPPQRPDPPLGVEAPTAPVLVRGATEPEPREDENHFGATITLTDSRCAVETTGRPLVGRRLRFHVELPVPKQTILDVVWIGARHTLLDLRSSLRGAGPVPETDRGGFEGWHPSYERWLPPYVDTSLQGRSDIGFPRGGMGPGRGTTALTMNTGWWGSWSGPRGGATAGTYAVICYQRRAKEWSVLGVAGPVEVGSEPGDFVVDVRSGELTPLPGPITRLEGSRYEVSPDGTQLLFLAKEHASSTTQIFLANLDGTRVRKLTDGFTGVSAGSWSPDGTKVVYAVRSATHGGRVRAYLLIEDVATGARTRLASGTAFGFRWPRFSPDGEAILFTDSLADPHQALLTIPVAGGESSILLRDAWGAVYSPDGQTVAFERSATIQMGLRGGSGSQEIRLADADGSDVRFFLEAGSWHPRWSPDGTRIAFVDDHGVHVVDVTTREITRVARGLVADWLNDHTLIVEVR
jgi:hypothetical protein